MRCSTRSLAKRTGLQGEAGLHGLQPAWRADAKTRTHEVIVRPARASGASVRENAMFSTERRLAIQVHLMRIAIEHRDALPVHEPQARIVQMLRLTPCDNSRTSPW